MTRGISPILGPEQARFSLLYVEDLAEAVLKWCESAVGTGQLFEMHDGKPGGYTWSEVADTIARLCNRRVLQIKVPVTVLRVMAFLNLTAARLLGYAPILTPWKVRELTHLDWVCDNEALSRETGWRPTISLEEGLRRTIGLPCG
jgi:nucleoside-diphosphate-sugar epimerase